MSYSRRDILKTVLLASGVSLMLYCNLVHAEDASSFTIYSDGTASVHGIVTESLIRVPEDGNDVLALKSGDRDILVEYEIPQHIENEEAAETGRTIKPGDTISALGKYKKLGKFDMISTWSDNAYYLHK